VEEFREAPKIPVVVVLDNIRSAYNVGAVFRTADAFRVEMLYLCGRTCVPPHVEIYKTALGAEDSVEWKHYPDIVLCISELKAKGYIPVGIEQTDSSIALQEFRPEKGARYALLLGNEVDGVTLEALNACDVVLEIPQEGTKHSLNISVAAGVVIWEFFRRFL